MSAFLRRVADSIAAALMTIAVALGLIAIHLDQRRRAAEVRDAKSRADVARATRTARQLREII